MHAAGSWADPAALQLKRTGCRQHFRGPTSLLFDLEVSPGPGLAHIEAHVADLHATRDGRKIPSCTVAARARRAPWKVAAIWTRPALVRILTWSQEAFCPQPVRDTAAAKYSNPRAS